ncbi:MAG: Holo-[acyl-carrier protein] synthase (EC [uncultured Sulfurovum sp.]|uniref:Holo-[acyl-carrier-protein] synthase n=1 Tax=uncultured Sulfurovum sp. TaxID=269237 RepID=A0A6S6TE73_9BACT|nr:MAG: Holo-[acyl-carrier protein] synthase (EC [uncultured Sulfurovum sp.]
MKIGTDISVVARIENAHNKFGTKFLDKFLNEEEQQLSQKANSLAGYWAAKEAIAKALGCGIGAELSFHDIILYKDKKNAPHFKLSTKAQKLHQIQNSSLSIAHDGGFAIAIALVSQINNEHN